MLKLGITRRAELSHGRTLFGARRLASLLLLKDLHENGGGDPENYNTILRLMRVPNGTWKDTFQGRFRHLDESVLDVLQEIYQRGQELRVMDLGVSSGITSVEFYQALRREFSVHFLATDLWRDAYAIGDDRAGWTVILDASGRELQYVVGRFVLPGQGQESIAYPVNRTLRWLSRKWLLPRVESIFRKTAWEQRRDFEPIRFDAFTATRLPLLSHECLTLMAQDPRFRFRVVSILESTGERADVIRAMNILTPGHFKDSELRKAIRCCLTDLKPGGVLILGRSPTDNPTEVTATIYREEGGVLRVLRRFNSGYECEGLVQEEQGRIRLERTDRA